MLYVLPLMLALAWADDSGLGCFSSVDTSVSKGSDVYQTLSLCASSCGESYPYVAIKNGGTCYCLLSLPSSLTDSSNCNVKCNGYGTVMCGGTNAFTVFSGLGSSDSAASASGSSNLKLASGGSGSSTSLKLASTSSLSSSSGQSLGSSSSKAASSNSGSTSITSAPDDAASTSVVTSTSSENGSVIYKTITTLSTPTSSQSGSHSGSQKKSTNIGPIVGGVVGGLAALALIGVGIFFFIRHRNSEDDDEEEFYEKGSSTLGRGTGTSKSNKSKVNPAFDMPMSNPFAHPTDDFADKRMSKMTQSGLTDPRLNPTMMGRRRLSEGSLADETDYSRKILGVANP